MIRVSWLAALALLATADARAQGTGGIAGHVTDKTGGVIAGATVEVSGPTQKTASTDAGGAYRILGLAPGTYLVLVTRPRFAPFAQSDVTVAAGPPTTVDAALELAPIEETTTVESQAPLGLDASESAGAIVLKGTTRFRSNAEHPSECDVRDDRRSARPREDSKGLGLRPPVTPRRQNGWCDDDRP